MGVMGMDAKVLGAQAAHPLDPEMDRSVSCNSWGSAGLTKREMFAAMAMQGLLPLANPGVSGRAFKKALREVAESATYAADALLAELAKETP